MLIEIHIILGILLGASLSALAMVLYHVKNLLKYKDSDLRTIKGIGPKTEAMLNACGYYRVQDMADDYDSDNPKLFDLKLKGEIMTELKYFNRQKIGTMEEKRNVMQKIFDEHLAAARVRVYTSRKNILLARSECGDFYIRTINCFRDNNIEFVGKSHKTLCVTIDNLCFNIRICPL